MKGELMVNSLSDFTAEGLTAGIRNVRAEDAESQPFVRLDRCRVICLDVKQDPVAAPALREVMQTDQRQGGAESAALCSWVDADDVHLAQTVP